MEDTGLQMLAKGGFSQQRSSRLFLLFYYDDDDYFCGSHGNNQSERTKVWEVRVMRQPPYA